MVCAITRGNYFSSKEVRDSLSNGTALADPEGEGASDLESKRQGSKAEGMSHRCKASELQNNLFRELKG